VRLLAAPDKFRGTISAKQAAASIAQAARRAGWEAIDCPLSDGGEGFRSLFAGVEIPVIVEGPLGHRVQASFTLDGELAVIEMAEAAGRALLPHPSRGDPLRASTRGVGELLRAAMEHGATRIIVGCGGSATTDGGLGAIEVLEGSFDPRRCRLQIATDVDTDFVDAAWRFAPQKGADPRQVELLAGRLEALVLHYRQRFGVDVSALRGAGAAGGLAGGLAALGGEICSGFELVADTVDLDDKLRRVDLVVTGEGAVDASTLEGKTVASLVERLAPPTSILIVAGSVEPGSAELLSKRSRAACRVLSLSERFGLERSLNETSQALSELVEETLRSHWPFDR
jgi:glycerate kinase